MYRPAKVEEECRSGEWKRGPIGLALQATIREKRCQVIKQRGIWEYMGLPFCVLSVAAAAVHLSAYQTTRGTETVPEPRDPSKALRGRLTPAVHFGVTKIRQFATPSNACQPCFELVSQVIIRVSDSHVFCGVSAVSAGLDSWSCPRGDIGFRLRGQQ